MKPPSSLPPWWKQEAVFFLLVILPVPKCAEARFTTPPVLVASVPSGHGIRNGRVIIDAMETTHITWKQFDLSEGPTPQALVYGRSGDGGLTFSVARGNLRGFAPLVPG